MQSIYIHLLAWASSSIWQILSPVCDMICGSGTHLVGPHGTFGGGRLDVLARWPCYNNCPLWGESLSSGCDQFNPKKGGLGFPWVHPPARFPS